MRLEFMMSLVPDLTIGLLCPFINGENLPREFGNWKSTIKENIWVSIQKTKFSTNFYEDRQLNIEIVLFT